MEHDETMCCKRTSAWDTGAVSGFATAVGTASMVPDATDIATCHIGDDRQGSSCLTK